MNTGPVRIVVTDSNVLINLMHVSRLGLLARIPQHEFVVPDHVREEITNPQQRALLDTAIVDGWLTLEPITDLEAITVSFRNASSRPSREAVGFNRASASRKRSSA